MTVSQSRKNNYPCPSRISSKKSNKSVIASMCSNSLNLEGKGKLLYCNSINVWSKQQSNMEIGELNGKNTGKQFVKISWIRTQSCSKQCGDSVISNLLRVAQKLRNKASKTKKDTQFSSNFYPNPMKNFYLALKLQAGVSISSFLIIQQSSHLPASTQKKLTNPASIKSLSS